MQHLDILKHMLNCDRSSSGDQSLQGVVWLMDYYHENKSYFQSS